MGHMHKDQEKTDKTPHEIEICKCAHCEHFYNNQEDWQKMDILTVFKKP